MTDPWTDRLSEYVDGTLRAEERAGFEAHLDGCATCRATADDLRAVATRASTLADTPPTRDLWDGIAARIGAIPLRSNAAAAPGVERRPRRFVFSLPQLLAAGIALVLLSSATVMLVQSAGGDRSGVTDDPSSGVLAVAAGTEAIARYDQAITDLVQVLDAGRTRLDPRTVRILERNLQIIDAALYEARHAVSQDPASLYLQHHLAQTMQRKLDVLRHAVSLVGAAS